ncbi:hypothetical protein RCL1_000350 [Eukaryota sp. TZLM3-RCL]
MSFKERFSGKISVISKTGSIEQPPPSSSAFLSQRKPRQPLSAHARFSSKFADKIVDNRPPLTHRATVSDLERFLVNDNSVLPPTKDSSSAPSFLPRLSSEPITAMKSPPSRSSQPPNHSELNPLPPSDPRKKAADYQPYTLSDYRKIQPKQYYELGKLQPNLDTDEYKQKKERLDRQKQYGNLSRQHNQQVGQKIKPREVPKPEPPKSRRQIALEFASRLPKPTQKSQEVSHGDVSSDPPRSVFNSKLAELHEMHLRDREKVDKLVSLYA